MHRFSCNRQSLQRPAALEAHTDPRGTEQMLDLQLAQHQHMCKECLVNDGHEYGHLTGFLVLHAVTGKEHHSCKIAARMQTSSTLW